MINFNSAAYRNNERQNANPKTFEAFCIAAKDLVSVQNLSSTALQTTLLGVAGDCFALPGYALGTALGMNYGGVGRLLRTVLSATTDECGTALFGTASSRVGGLTPENIKLEVLQGLTSRALVQGVLGTMLEVFIVPLPLRLVLLAGGMMAANLASESFIHSIFGGEAPTEEKNGWGYLFSGLTSLETVLLGHARSSIAPVFSIDHIGKTIIEEHFKPVEKPIAKSSAQPAESKDPSVTAFLRDIAEQVAVNPNATTHNGVFGLFGLGAAQAPYRLSYENIKNIHPDLEKAFTDANWPTEQRRNLAEAPWDYNDFYRLSNTITTCFGAGWTPEQTSELLMSRFDYQSKAKELIDYFAIRGRTSDADVRDFTHTARQQVYSAKAISIEGLGHVVNQLSQFGWPSDVQVTFCRTIMDGNNIGEAREKMAVMLDACYGINSFVQAGWSQQDQVKVVTSLIQHAQFRERPFSAVGGHFSKFPEVLGALTSARWAHEDQVEFFTALGTAAGNMHSNCAPIAMTVDMLHQKHWSPHNQFRLLASLADLGKEYSHPTFFAMLEGLYDYRHQIPDRDILPDRASGANDEIIKLMEQAVYHPRFHHTFRT